MIESERRALVAELAGAVSTQAKVANRAWLSLITAALFAVLPHASTSDNVSLPWNIGEVSAIWFHTIAFFIVVVLAIFFAAAHAQQIRAQRLTQKIVDSLVDENKLNDAVHPRELYDMLRTPSLNRVAPLAQLLRGRYQFYLSASQCPGWLRLLSVVYYGIIKLVSLIVFYVLPVWALWRAYALLSATRLMGVAIAAVGIVAGIALLQVFLTDAIYTRDVLQHLWNEKNIETAPPRASPTNKEVSGED
jgi:hypothetical protein